MPNFFSENEKNFISLDEKIRDLCNGLVYISEQDAAITLFKGDRVSDVNGQTILQQAGTEANAQVEEIAFDDFFQKLTTEKDWFGKTENVRAKRFGVLQNLLAVNLTELKVFRIGKVRIDIFVVGLDEEGRLTGVRTAAVET